MCIRDRHMLAAACYLNDGDISRAKSENMRAILMSGESYNPAFAQYIAISTSIQSNEMITITGIEYDNAECCKKEMCIRDRFQNNHVMRIMRHRGYTGYMIAKENTSGFIPELQIVEESIYEDAMAIVEMCIRDSLYSRQRNITLATSPSCVWSTIWLITTRSISSLIFPPS